MLAQLAYDHSLSLDAVPQDDQRFVLFNSEAQEESALQS